MTAYRAGRDVEHLTRYHLDAEGYITQRSAGSKGWIDVSARKPGQILDVQVKRDDTVKLTAADWNRLVERAAWVGAVPILAFRDLAAGCPDTHRVGGRRCAVQLWRLTGLYVPRAPFARQPVELFVTDVIAAAGGAA